MGFLLFRLPLMVGLPRSMNAKPLAPFFLLVAVLFSACEDPSNVGLGLIGESGGEPEVVSAPIQTFEERSVRDVTGGAVIVQANVNNPAPRVLAGVVDDPLLGVTQATAFVDFGGVGGISDEFRDGPVTSVELLLRRDYVYGDTTSTVEFEVLDMTSSWDGLAPVDTTLAPGGLATTASVLASDRNVEIPLPQAWIDANSEVLRSTTFTADFQGLALRPVSGNAVVGFNTALSALRVVAAGDTVNYVVNRVLTTTDAPDRSADSPILQDGTGRGLALQLAPDVASLGPAGVNGVVVRVPADTVASTSQTPAGFIRPLLPSLRLTIRTQNDEGEFVDAYLADALLSDGRYLWPLGALPEQLFQEMIAGEPMELHVSAPPGLFSVNPIILTSPGDPTRSPMIILTLTPATV